LEGKAALMVGIVGKLSLMAMSPAHPYFYGSHKLPRAGSKKREFNFDKKVIKSDTHNYFLE
jgi:hypothetical protein